MHKKPIWLVAAYTTTPDSLAGFNGATCFTAKDRQGTDKSGETGEVERGGIIPIPPIPKYTTGHVM